MRPKIGVIGAGIMGTAHGKSIHFCQKMGLIDCDFVALAETDAERRESFAAKAGVGWTTDDVWSRSTPWPSGFRRSVRRR